MDDDADTAAIIIVNTDVPLMEVAYFFNVEQPDPEAFDILFIRSWYTVKTVENIINMLCRDAGTVIAKFQLQAFICFRNVNIDARLSVTIFDSIFHNIVCDVVEMEFISLDDELRPGAIHVDFGLFKL